MLYTSGVERREARGRVATLPGRGPAPPVPCTILLAQQAQPCRVRAGLAPALIIAAFGGNAICDYEAHTWFHALHYITLEEGSGPPRLLYSHCACHSERSEESTCQPGFAPACRFFAALRMTGYERNGSKAGNEAALANITPKLW